MTVTKEQALAFVEALTGWEDVSDRQCKPKSPHAHTHLEAILGYRRVPGTGEIAGLPQYIKYGMNQQEIVRSYAFFDYLQAVINVLDPRVDTAPTVVMTQKEFDSFSGRLARATALLGRVLRLEHARVADGEEAEAWGSDWDELMEYIGKFWKEENKG